MRVKIDQTGGLVIPRQWRQFLTSFILIVPGEDQETVFHIYPAGNVARADEMLKEHLREINDAELEDADDMALFLTGMSYRTAVVNGRISFVDHDGYRSLVAPGRRVILVKEEDRISVRFDPISRPHMSAPERSELRQQQRPPAGEAGPASSARRVTSVIASAAEGAATQSRPEIASATRGSRLAMTGEGFNASRFTLHDSRHSKAELRIDQTLEAMRAPAVAMVDYKDVMDHFSKGQVEELFAVPYLKRSELRLVIYNADLTDDRLKPFRQLRNVRILSGPANTAYEKVRSELRGGVSEKPIFIHLSKSTADVRNQFSEQTRSELRFYRYAANDQESGLLLAALLNEAYAELGRRLEGIGLDKSNYFTLVEGFLRNELRAYYANYVIAIAA